VDLQADAVSHPVAVRVPEPRRLDQRARGRIRIASVHAGRDRSETGELRFEAQRMQLTQALGDVAHRECTRAVRAIAVEDAAGVDGHEHTRLDRLVARHCMRSLRRRSGRDDRLEGHALCAPVAEAPLDPPRELLLAATREPLLREGGEDLVESALPRRMIAISSASLTARRLSTRPVLGTASTPASTSTR
jgi:hypothetical protein